MSEHFPVNVQQWSYNHIGGTKSYHIVVATASNDKTLIVFRYGKTGAFGQMQALTFNTARDAADAVNKKDREKSSGGYSQVGPVTTEEALTRAELQEAFGLIMFNKLGRGNVDYIAGERVSQPDQREIERQEKADRAQEAARLFEIAMQKQADEENEKQRANNPLWGAF